MPETRSKLLITGANGFVGARLCGKFIAEGFEVVAGVRPTADLSSLKGLNVELRYGDVTQPETLPPLVEGIDYLIHNAGVVKAPTAEVFFDVNEKGTITLMQAVSEHNRQIRKVIYVSSSAVVGPSEPGRPVTEDDPASPITTYGRSKLAGERGALSFADRFNVIALRPSGIYGPGDKEIFSFFQTVHYGIRPYIGNSNRRLQLVHVDDLCHAMVLAITRETESGQSFFIAEDRSYTMKELIGILRRVSGRRSLPLYLPAPLFKVIAGLSESAFKLVGAVPMLTREKANELLATWELSTAKAQAAFGYRSRIPFKSGAAETYEWYLRQGWLK